ncbi:Lytic polysaccharide monooxygenase [Tuber magnatum]|uniref:Lytic polysaccharide monooxygenase n=1 Tax=Tuber magnatum TaxID=42249 RepID=A0A317SR33_9PEZI|nr:Lytic polysaccharide monooxygenase [Tuber magnatum]
MKFSAASVAALSAFLPQIVSAHVTMVEPKQWFVPEVIRGSVETSDSQQHPLQADGSNFPCHGVPPEDVVATYEPGSTQKLKLLGTAVHGGGSGQMSITYDVNPTKDSKFRVMQSWMGDHPVKAAGNLGPQDRDPQNLGAQFPLDSINPLSFKVPSGLPKGKAVVAWTWFNKLGNREMYMKCATVEITGQETSTAAFDALPEMFRANSGNGCEVPANIDAIAFKNPGPATVGTGVTPIACDSTKVGSGSPEKKPDTGSPSSSSIVVKPTGTSSQLPTGTAYPTYGGTTPPAPTKTSAATRPAATTKPVTATQAPAPSQQPQPPAGGACVEGAIVCNADRTWSQCGSGRLQNMGPVAPGMACKNGVFDRQRRSIRFSNDHMRRRHAGAEVSQ